MGIAVIPAASGASFSGIQPTLKHTINSSQTISIPAGTVVWYNSGSCYSRIGVNTLQAAKAVQRIAGMETANGGYMHGARLGTISALQQPDGGTHYDITC